MKYKVGDKVRLGVYPVSASGKKKLVGEIATIGKVRSDFFGEAYPYIMTPDNGYCWCDAELSPVVDSKVVITVNGSETLARLYEGNKVIKSASAECSPEDTFDFSVGAKIAFERLMGIEPKTCVEGEEKPTTKYKSGDKVRIIRNTCHHFADIGEIITLTNDNVNQSYYPSDSHKWNYEEHGGYICEADIEPYVEPKYYNGKVVCIKSGYGWWTVGKVYNVVDGIITCDGGYTYPNRNQEPYRDAEDVRHAGCDDWDDDGRHNRRNEFVPFVE